MNTKTLNFNTLSKIIDEIAGKWDISGGVVVLTDGNILHKGVYGYADREKGIPTPLDSTYLISSKYRLFLGLSIMQLIDRKQVSLYDTLDKYIPEYIYSYRITIKQLLYHSTGIPDYFYSRRMIALSRSKQHQSLSGQERFQIERYEYESPVSFKDVLEIISRMPLEFEPGARTNDRSASNNVFLQEVIERVTVLSLIDYQTRHILKPLGMSETTCGCNANTVSYGVIQETVSVRLPLVKQLDHTFVTTINDMAKLANGMANKQLLSEKAWKSALLYDRKQMSIIAENANGIACSEGTVLGYELNIYFDQQAKIAYIQLANEAQVIKRVNGEWCYFRKDLRQVVEKLTTFPEHTSIKPYSENNFRDATNLTINENQQSFVCDVKSGLCYAFAKPGVRKPYVLMEGKRSIGLMVLSIDCRKSFYNVDVLLIDKKYQNRGYGKILLSGGLEILKQKGAKRIEIGVSRYNIPAQKLYFGLGFEIAAIYKQEMALRIDLE